MRCPSTSVRHSLAPRVTRVAVIRDPTVPGGVGQFAAIQGAAVALGVELVPVDMRSNAEIDRGVTAFARQPNGGLITTSPRSAVHRSTIIALAARYRLPAVYPYRYHALPWGVIGAVVAASSLLRSLKMPIKMGWSCSFLADLPTPAPGARRAHRSRRSGSPRSSICIANVRRRHFDFSSAGCGRGTIPCTENECRLLLHHAARQNPIRVDAGFNCL